MDPSIENPMNKAQTKDGGSSALTAEEQRKLRDCERTIELSQQSTVAVAVALLHVCDRRLYRESFRTFEIYCRKRWEMRSTYAYDLIHFARLLSEFSANADIKILPKLEGQTRSLAALLNAADRATVWRRALEVARGGQITGKIVTRARQEFWMENPERAPTRLRTAQNSPQLDTSSTHKIIKVELTVSMETLQMIQKLAAGVGATLDRVVSQILETHTTKSTGKASSVRRSSAKGGEETLPATGDLFSTVSSSRTCVVGKSKCFTGF